MTKQNRCSKGARKTKSGKCSHTRGKKHTKSMKQRKHQAPNSRKKTKTIHKKLSGRRKSASASRDFTHKMGMHVENKKMCCQGSTHSGDQLQAALNTLCFDKDATPTRAQISTHYDKCIVQVDPEANRTDPRAEEFAQNVNDARFMLDSRSPSARRKSPSARHKSPSARHKSPSARRKSPSARRKSPSARPKSPSARRKSPSVSRN